MVVSSSRWLRLLVIVAAIFVVACIAGNDFIEDPTGTWILPPVIYKSKIIKAHSFLPPLLSNPWIEDISHWEFGLHAVVSDPHVRLTPAKSSTEGFMWNMVPMKLHSFVARVGIRVHNAGSSVGADGLAIWLIDRRSVHGGPLFGIADHVPFRGFGIIFDSFDNDHRRDNPSVSLISNPTGSADKRFDVTGDFLNTRDGGCIFDFRSTSETMSPHDVVHVVITYRRGEPGEGGLSLELTKGRNHLSCVNVPLELTLEDSDYFFGLSAHTGGLSDHHDVYYFTVEPHPEDSAFEGGDEDAKGKDTPFSHDAEKQEQTRWKPQK